MARGSTAAYFDLRYAQLLCSTFSFAARLCTFTDFAAVPRPESVLVTSCLNLPSRDCAYQRADHVTTLARDFDIVPSRIATRLSAVLLPVCDIAGAGQVCALILFSTCYWIFHFLLLSGNSNTDCTSVSKTLWLFQSSSSLLL